MFDTKEYHKNSRNYFPQLKQFETLLLYQKETSYN